MLFGYGIVTSCMFANIPRDLFFSHEFDVVVLVMTTLVTELTHKNGTSYLYEMILLRVSSKTYKIK